jgi:two-component system, sensor histidine kinase LadS
MTPLFRRWPWLLLLSMVIAAPALAATPPAVLSADLDRLALAPHMRFLHEVEAEAGAAEMLRRARSGEFQPLPGGSPTFGFQRGAFWFHIEVENRRPDQPRWLLLQEYPLSDFVDVYLPQADGSLLHQGSGDMRPFGARAVKHRHPNFLVDLPPFETVELLVRVESGSSMQVPLVLYTQTALTGSVSDAQIGIGLYYGILIALFFYNLILWLTLRDASYFWYMFHITAFGLVLFCLNGLAFEYLWPNALWLQDKSVPLSICLAQIGMQQFARMFLELETRWTFGNRVGLALIVFFIALAVVSLFVPYRVSTPLASAAVLPSVGWILFVSVVSLRRGYRPAGLFLLAWLMLLLGTAAFTLVAFGVLPKVFVTEYGVQIGSALEMILLSFALSYRYAALRNENERIVAEARDQLESRVDQRTRELSLALEQLADAHDRLREFSRRDGLTGIYNRRHLEESLLRIILDAQEQRRTLTLIMADIDHFKLVNDTHGHLVGDDCLRFVARRIGEIVTPERGVAARYGGEEFAIVLPDCDAARAEGIAERIRSEIAAEPLVSDGVSVRLTISLGISEIRPGFQQVEPTDALRQADQALYQAKAGGRNQVRRHGEPVD